MKRIIPYILACLVVATLTWATMSTSGLQYKTDIMTRAYQSEKMSHASTTTTALRYAMLYKAATVDIRRLWDASIGLGTDIGCTYCHRNVVGG